MKKYGKFIGALILVLIEFIFYLDMNQKDMEFFFLAWSFIWLVMLIFGFVNVFKKGKSSSIGNPLGHPRDFLVFSGVKTNNIVKSNTFGTIVLFLLLFVLNLTGYFIVM